MPPARSFPDRAAARRAIRGLGLAALLAAPAAGRAEPAAEQAVLRAAQAAAATSDLELCRYGTLGSAGQPPGAFALLRDRKQPDSLQLARAIFQQGDTTWTIAVKETGVYGLKCTATGYPPKPSIAAEQVETITLADLDDVAPSAWTLTFFDRQLVIQQESELRNAPSGTDDWVSLRSIWSAGSEPDEQGQESAYVLLLPRGAAAAKTVPKTASYVTHGKQDGPRDADLDVKAELDGGKVRLAVTVTDDRDLPLPSPRAPDADFLRSDHLEIWLQPGPRRGEVRQLGVARLPDGTAHARWLHPRKLAAPLPAVAAPAPGRFTIELDAAALFGKPRFDPAARHELPFAAAFSDSDQPGKRQQTVVATSQLRWGKPESFGALIWFENGARFPPMRGGSRANMQITRAKP